MRQLFYLPCCHDFLGTCLKKTCSCADYQNQGIRMNNTVFHLNTKRLKLIIPKKDYAQAILEYYLRNDAHLNQYSGANYKALTVEKIENRILKQTEEFKEQTEAVFYIHIRNKPEKIIGTVSFYDIFKDDLQLAFIGYSIDKDFEGQGYMTEATNAAIEFIFKEWNIHKIMASYMPRNQRSANLVKRLGFVVEGYAREESFINEVWEDAIQASLLNNNWNVERWKAEYQS
jgi:ribosomal-protein-alanine N-acetyltransferase